MVISVLKEDDNYNIVIKCYPDFEIIAKTLDQDSLSKYIYSKYLPSGKETYTILGKVYKENDLCQENQS